MIYYMYKHVYLFVFFFSTVGVIFQNVIFIIVLAIIITIVFSIIIAHYLRYYQHENGETVSQFVIAMRFAYQDRIDSTLEVEVGGGLASSPLDPTCCLPRRMLGDIFCWWLL